jgi:hypothetical protein
MLAQKGFSRQRQPDNQPWMDGSEMSGPEHR